MTGNPEQFSYAMLLYVEALLFDHGAQCLGAADAVEFVMAKASAKPSQSPPIPISSPEGGRAENARAFVSDAILAAIETRNRRNK